MNHHLTISIFTLLLSSAVLDAQDRGRAPLERSTLTTIDGRAPRADGPSYRAEFDPSGVCFTPVLGRAAPRELPLRLATRAMTRGGRTHSLAAAEPRRTGKARVSYRRAPGITERFEIRDDGIAWSFELAQPLAGSGDLVVRAHADTELTAPPGAYANGLQLSYAAAGGVSLDAVTGIDACGARCAGSMRWDGAAVELVLPATFVDAATYPLVIDPLIGATRSVSGSNTHDDRKVDIAWDAGSGRYLCVWEKAFALSSIDVRGQLLDTNGVPVGSALAIASGPLMIRQSPAVCNVRVSGTFFVAWRSSATILGPFDLFGRSVGANGAMSTEVTLLRTNFDSESAPALSGERTLLDDDAILVWESGQQIYAAEVDVPPAPATPTPIVASSRVLSASPTSTYANPRISKNGGDAGVHCVVWEHRTPFGTFTVGRPITRDAVPLAGQTQLIRNAIGERPLVDGDGERFLVAHGFRATGGDLDIRAGLYRYNSATAQLESQCTPFLVTDASSIDDREPSLALLGPMYAFAWNHETGLLQSEVQVRTFDALRCSPCEPAQSLAVDDYASFPAIGAQWAGGSASDECLIAWSSSSNTPPFAATVRAQRFEGIGAGGTVSILPYGCAGGGVLSLTGPFAFGNDVRFDLTSAAPSAAAAALHIGAGRPVIPCGSCRIVPPFIAIPMTVQGGAAASSFFLGCSPGLVGLSWDVQAAVAFTSTAPCPIVPGVAVSNGLACTFGF